MAQTNHERVGRALELVNSGLKPFVEREMKSVHGNRWFAVTKQILANSHLHISGTEASAEWDSAGLLKVMWDSWNDVFSKTLGRAERSIVSELIEIRNKWAHQKTFTTDDAYRAMDSIHRLLNSVNAAKEADEIDKQRTELLRLKFDEQARHEKRKAASVAVEGQPVAGLKPWREVVTPHPDVASGRYQQAEFAADLWQVYKKQGSEEYRNPVEFFRRTFLTAGLKDMLVGALMRLAGTGGDPVVELQTNFGGGKTHSMLALYHLFSGTPASELPGLEAVFNEAKTGIPASVKRVVIVGNKISPGQPDRKEDGTLVRTLWGELAWQLGGKEGYALVKQADETATNPGDALSKLFKKYAPCLILIDEWVAYARQLHEAKDLPGGDFETHFTFAQTLSEEVKAVKQCMLVVSIPASTDAGVVSPTAGINDEEVGGARGRAALLALKNAIGRVEAPWRPANAEESFEIVRRRLFQTITDPQMFVARDTVAKAFCDLYRSQHQEFPPECREADYERKLKIAYPIHPEVFERLYQDWSGLVKFQRTRGVLRLMAAVIHSLWERDDKSVLIMPATIPLDEPRVQSEITRYLPDGWEMVIEKDIDGPDSLPKKIDGEKPNLGRYSACRRVARTLFLDSAPTPGAANRGVEDRRIKLGCVQPGEGPAVFGDALRHLAQTATYLYQDNARYWYATQPTVIKLADDRAEQMKREPDRVAEEIKARVRDDLRTRGEFSKVHPFPSTSGDVPDELETRLVVLSLENPYAKEAGNTAISEAEQILNSRGNSPRLYKNTLVFLAADRTRLNELDEATRYFLAWKSIEEDKQKLNLDNFQSNQAATQRGNWDGTIKNRLGETFQWLLVPTQPSPQGPVEWQAIRLSGQDALAVRVSKKLKNDSQMVLQYASTLLRADMDKIPLWRGNHVPVQQIVEDYAQYLYLQRMRDPDVVLAAMRDGVGLMMWANETFAFAESWDEKKQRYLGLQGGRMIHLTPDNTGLLVKPDEASAQIAADRPQPPQPGGGGSETTITGGDGGTPVVTPPVVSPVPERLKRFHGSVHLDAARIGRDAGKIAEEIVQHLSLLPDSDVEIVMEIRAEIPNGAPDNVVRTVTENCRTLKFDSQGFEKE